MSKLEIRRKKWGYETDTPLCSNCVQFEPSRLVLRDSLPVGKSAAHCKAGGFTVRPNACCDRWKGRKGATLMKAAA